MKLVKVPILSVRKGTMGEMQRNGVLLSSSVSCENELLPRGLLLLLLLRVEDFLRFLLPFPRFSLLITCTCPR